MSQSTEPNLKPGPVCGVCALFPSCNAVCSVIAELLPSLERGRLDPEDLPRLHLGIRLTNAILDHEEVLTHRQREVVQLYYRESLLQHEIAERLNISQQAVNDSLQRARTAIGRFLREGAPASAPAAGVSRTQGQVTVRRRGAARD